MRQREDLGADPQAGVLRGGSVHVKANLAILDEEADHAAACGEGISFTDRENVGRSRRIQNVTELLRITLDNERRPRACKGLIPFDSANEQWTSTDGSRLEKMLSRVRRRPFADDDYDERISCAESI